MKTLLSSLLILAFTGALGQDYEIRAVNRGSGMIAVEARTTGVPATTGNHITDIVFGLKWKSIHSVDLGAAITTSYNIKKSGSRRSKDDYHFQAFYADNTPFLFPGNWPVGSWIEIMRISNTLNSSGTGIFEICEAGFDLTSDPNVGIDLADHSPVINGSASAVVLPVGLTRFDARPVLNAIQLSWQTSSERNNRGFTVTRSRDALNFDSIGWVTGSGNSSSPVAYTFTDPDVGPGILYYYRLRQEDHDHRFSFSDIRSARLSAGDGELFLISPNPVTSTLKIAYTGNAPVGILNLEIIDSKGAQVHESEKTIDAGGFITLNLSQAASGQYYLIIREKNRIIFKQSFQKI